MSGSLFRELAYYSIIGLVSLLALLPLVASAFNNEDATLQAGDVSDIVQYYRTAYYAGGYPAAGTALDPTQISGRLDTKIVSAGQLVTRTTGAVMTGTSTGTAFTLNVPGLPTDQCVSLLQRGQLGGNVLSVAVNGAAAINLPLPPAVTAGALCNAAANANVLLYTARR
jgi:hypothetical protein